MNTLSLRTVVRNAAAVFSGVLRRRHPPGRAGRVQPTDRLRPRPPGRAAVATPGPRSRLRPRSPSRRRPSPSTSPPGDAWRSPPSPWASAPARSRTCSASSSPTTAPITRPSDAGSPTRPRRPNPSWRRSTRRASPRSGRSRSTRSFLGATDPGRHRAGEHDRRLLRERRRPQGRDLGEATGAVRPPGVRRLRRRQGDRQGGLATRPGPPRRPRGPDPGARPGRLPHHDGGQTRPGPALATSRGGLGEGGGRRRRGRPVETARDRRPGRGPGRPRRLGPGDRVVRADRAPRSGLGPGPRGARPVPAPTADSTTAATPRPRSPRPSRT